MIQSFQIGLISPGSHVSAIGTRQISACLKAAGWSTRMIFLPDPSELVYAPDPHRHDYPPDVLEQVCELCADLDLVGISLMSNFFGRARALTQAIHQRLTVPVIWGGVHPTLRPEESLTWADLVCVGEGEQAIVELVKRMAARQAYADIPNIWSKDDAGRVIANPVRPLDCSLDDLPLLDYQLEQQYVLHQGNIIPLTKTLLAHYMLNSFANRISIVHMICAARGCPYKCTYCCGSSLAQIYPDWNRVRRRSPEHVIAEIKVVQQLVPDMKAVMFLDDTFLATSSAEIRRFSEAYQDQVNLPFYILATPGSINAEKLHCLVQAGLQDVEIGIQTGSQRTRKLFRRSESNEQVLAAAQCLNKYQRQIPYPRYDIISDNPYETHSDQLETLQLLYQLPRPFRFYMFSLTFYPGTELYRQAKADGLIQDDEQDVYRKNYLQLEPSYYNLMLWCIHRNLPRWLLRLLIHPLTFSISSSSLMQWPVRACWKALKAVRTWQMYHNASWKTLDPEPDAE